MNLYTFKKYTYIQFTDAVKKRYRKIDDRTIESTIIDWFRRAADRIPKNRDNN